MAIGDRKTIDCTPTWRGLLPVLLAVLEDGDNAEAKANIKHELGRMADIADRFVALVKPNENELNPLQLLENCVTEIKYISAKENYPSWLADAEAVVNRANKEQ